MDLLSLVLTLRPLQLPENPAETPRWWGRAAHGLLLNIIRRTNDVLAEQLHAGPAAEERDSPGGQSVSQTENTVRPFTASTLMGRFPQRALSLEETYTLRLTAFRQDLVELLLAESGGGALAPGSSLELDYIPFEILSNSQSQIADALSPIEERSTAWASCTNYQELSAPFLLAKRPAPRRLSFQLTSPTTFKSGGRHVPLPLPELVFGSLLERWNAYAPIALPGEVRRFAAECLAVSQYDLQTRPVPQKSGGLRVGMTGRVTFATLNYDRYWMSVLAVLAQFSLFSGVGAGTTQGMGQCRSIPEA